MTQTPEETSALEQDLKALGLDPEKALAPESPEPDPYATLDLDLGEALSPTWDPNFKQRVAQPSSSDPPPPLIPVRGRQLSGLEIELLGRADPSEILSNENISTQQAPTIKRLKQIHHELARLIASGLSMAEVAASTGYSASRISILQKDPSFKGLVDHYKAHRDEIFCDVHKRMATLGLDAADELQERLETNPESFSVGQLTELMKATLDRGGFSPVQKTQSVSMSVTPEALAKIREKHAQATQGQVQILTSEETLFEETSDDAEY